MTERERLAGITSKIRAELIERGVVPDANGMKKCPICKKEVKIIYEGKCESCKRNI